MTGTLRQPSRIADLAARLALPVATLALFVATAAGYGIFRDELYYLACARHLDWGYVDHPPLVALLAAVAHFVAGDSLVGLRAFPALAFGATVLLVGDTCAALGGGRWARILAQLLAATAPVYLALFSVFSMNAFDVLIWAGLARLAVHLLGSGDPRLWLAFGALAGIGLENKLDVGLLGAGIAIGLLVARRFDVLRSLWLWLGGLIALGLLLPHVLWQVVHGWPTREFVANAQAGKIAILGPVGFVASQLETVGPVAAGLSVAGLCWLLIARSARPYRALGWAALVVLAVLSFSVSKPYYFSPAYVLLFPASAAALERWTVGRFVHVSRTLSLVLAASVAVFAPLAKPLLSEDDFVRYASALGSTPGSDEKREVGRLPQFFADMHGWRELAETTAKVYRALPADDRDRACVFAGNYGEAGAIDYFGPALGLPPAISGHNSYWMWGPDDCTGEVMVIIGGEPDEIHQSFAEVEAGAHFQCADCLPEQGDLTIWVARGLRLPLAKAWSSVRHYD